MCKLSRKCVIAIDGGAGVGKTTVSKKLSERLGIVYIDTGAMYRAIGLYFIQSNIEITDENILNNIEKINVDLKISKGSNKVYLNGIDVTSKIRTEEVSMAASNVSKNSNVRKMLVEKQRNIAGNMSVVIEGRDTTTVVFPNADIKIYLKSSIDVRAQRRYQDLKSNDTSLKLSQDDIKESLIVRDKQDTTRLDSPLKIADGALIIDTSNFTVEETVDKILDILKERVGIL